MNVQQAKVYHDYHGKNYNHTCSMQTRYCDVCHCDLNIFIDTQSVTKRKRQKASTPHGVLQRVPAPSLHISTILTSHWFVVAPFSCHQHSFCGRTCAPSGHRLHPHTIGCAGTQWSKSGVVWRAWKQIEMQNYTYTQYTVYDLRTNSSMEYLTVPHSAGILAAMSVTSSSVHLETINAAQLSYVR
jgi:hypothetical protein